MASAVAATAESRLQAAGIALTMGGEPTYVPDDPQGAEWSVAADGPTKLGYARALAAALQERAWPGSTLLYCPGKRYEGEVNPRWALRLITGLDGRPVAHWPQSADSRPGPMGTGPAATGRGPLPAESAMAFLAAIGRGLGLSLQPVPLRDPLDPRRRVWAVPLCHHQGDSEPDQTPRGWQAALWPLAEEQRELLTAQGPAGLRLPLQHFPEGVLQQVLTLEIDDPATPRQPLVSAEPAAAGWTLFLPPLARGPLEQLLEVVAQASAPWSQPELSGVLPLDSHDGWQVLGLTADPGVLEVNLPVCHSWDDYAQWITVLEQAGAAAGLRSWKRQGHRITGTGGGNHLLFGGPSLERNPFFIQPAWLVGLLRFWQHHPSLAYLFSGNSVGPASQAPRPDEGCASLLDLELAHRALERLPEGDQRVAIGETLRHLHADRSGNTHRSEISFDKFWNPAWSAGCQGLLEFRALESLPHSQWTTAVALLWRCLAVHLLEPQHRPTRLRDWGHDLHDRAMLPSPLWADLEQLLEELAADGLTLDPTPFRALWEWRFPVLLNWRSGSAALTIRQALEPWPLLCDTPVEGGTTSRFVDSSLRRFELIANPEFRRHHSLALQGRRLAWPEDPRRPVAVRYRQDALFPCLHPCLPIDLPLRLDLFAGRGGQALGSWVLEGAANGFEVLTDPAPGPAEGPELRAAVPGGCTLDLRLAD